MVQNGKMLIRHFSFGQWNRLPQDMGGTRFRVHSDRKDFAAGQSPQTVSNTYSARLVAANAEYDERLCQTSTILSKQALKNVTFVLVTGNQSSFQSVTLGN